MTTTDRRPGHRRILLAVALLAAPALLSACADDGGASGGDEPGPATRSAVSGIENGGEPADPTSDVPRPEADFRADVVVGDDAVRVSWTLVNRTGAELLVADRLPDDTGTPQRTGAAYVTGDVAEGADPGAIVVSQRVFAQPEGSTVDYAQAPKVGGTRVPAGSTARGLVEVPRPFVRQQPYGDDLGFGTVALPDPPSEVRFCLGVLPSPYPAQVAEQTGVAAPVIDHGLGNARAQYVFCSEPVALAGEPSS